MIPSKDLLREAQSLPVDERASLADSLLKTLNAPDESTDREWLRTARRRLEELRSGKVKPVPADEVFEGAGRRLNK